MDTGDTPDLSASGYTNMLTAFGFTFWEPSPFFSRQVWSSKWYMYINEKSSVLSKDLNLAIPIIWTFINALTGAAFYLFLHYKENIGTDFDLVMSMMIATIVLTKTWIYFINYIPWTGIFFVASLIPFGMSLATWAIMWDVLDPYHAIDYTIIWLWAPLPLWTFIATFVVGISIWIEVDDEVYNPEYGWGQSERPKYEALKDM